MEDYMSLNWIDPNDYSFNNFLLLDRFQIRLMMGSCGWYNDDEKWKANMGIALNANPVVKWYFTHRCPECSLLVDDLCTNAPKNIDKKIIKDAVNYTLMSVEDFIIHTTPGHMAKKCDYIKGWNKKHLYELADFTGKTVLDVGAGSGRLTFAAAEKAAWVYASEPVGTLRDFMRDKIKETGIKNVRVLDGLITELPFPDNTFDIVMSGHVVGDDWDNEIAEITRVCKNGGWLLNCPGDSEGDLKPCTELTSRGWEELHYIGSYGYNVYIHRKKVSK